MALPIAGITSNWLCGSGSVPSDVQACHLDVHATLATTDVNRCIPIAKRLTSPSQQEASRGYPRRERSTIVSSRGGGHSRAAANGEVSTEGDRRRRDSGGSHRGA